MSPKPRRSSSPAPAHPLQAQNEVVSRLRALPHSVGWRTTGAVLATLNARRASGDAATLADFRSSRGTRSGATAPRRPFPARACSPWSKQHQAVVAAPLATQAPPRAVRHGAARDRQFSRSAPRREEPAREAEATGGEGAAGGRARSRWRCESRRGRGGADGGEGGR